MDLRSVSARSDIASAVSAALAEYLTASAVRSA